MILIADIWYFQMLVRSYSRSPQWLASRFFCEGGTGNLAPEVRLLFEDDFELSSETTMPAPPRNTRPAPCSLSKPKGRVS